MRGFDPAAADAGGDVGIRDWQREGRNEPRGRDPSEGRRCDEMVALAAVVAAAVDRQAVLRGDDKEGRV